MSEWPNGRPFAKEHTGLVPVKAAVPMYVPHYDEQETTRAFAKQEREKSLITVTASTG